MHVKDMWVKTTQWIKAKMDGIAGAPADVSALARMAGPVLIVLAVTILSFLGVDILYKAVTLQAGFGPAAPANQSGRTAQLGLAAPSAQRYNIITERNLFLTTLQAIADKDAAGLLPSEEYTAFDLKGTIAIDPNLGYAVVEEKGKGKQKLYRLGDKIGSAQLVRITRNTAVLKSAEKEFVMRIKEVAEGSGPGRFGQGAASGISISRQEVTQNLGDLKSIMSQAVVRPFFAGGVQQGFVVSNIVPGSLYQKLGLQNGDVVMEVNSKRLESADDILQLVNVMQAGGSVSVNLLRNGQNETIHYSFH
ncbi:MAG: PDZ domain-containing protein [Deltaproteobacteria bacterium]|nr:PDZ domain-containing protein [Deltaproteobacteria bacterium]